MKKEKRMSRGGKIAVRLVCIVLVVLTVLQVCAFAMIGEWGVYNATKKQVEEARIAEVTRNCARNVLRWYLYHDVDAAHEYAGELYSESNINFEIYVGEKQVDKIENVDGLEPGGDGVLYEETFCSEELMAEDELWEEVWEADKEQYERRALQNSQGYKTTEYSITCRVADPVYADDLIVKTKRAANWAYEVRFPIIGGFLATAVAAAVLFGILVKKAGHVKGYEELQVSWLDRIPLELLTGIYLLVVCTLLFVTVDFGFGYSYVIQNIRATNYDFAYFIILGVGLGAAIASFFTLLFFESVSVRVKNGQWWKNTILFRLSVWLRGAVKKIAGHTAEFVAQKLPLVWKAILVFGVISFVEILVIAWTVSSYEFDFMIIIWFLEKGLLLAGMVFLLLQLRKLQEGGERLASGKLEQKIDTDRMFWEFKKHGENLNNIGVGIQHAVEERMKSERFKTELITNVSHDIKTPLTSIINYVDLLEKEELQNSNAKEYLEVLHRQSARLKKLIEDLMEASKASTGALAVNFEDCEVGVMLAQAAGEFEEKLRSKELTLVIRKPEEELAIRADGRHLWRVFDNLLNNIYKYSQPGTRVYLNLEKKENQVEIIFRNTSKCELNISGEELQERFVRGDSSRNTEGSGLGLSIATSLTELMGGKFELVIDGDLFKVILTFPCQ